jgi:pilus assembly protein CpaE
MHAILACSSRNHPPLQQLEGLVRSRAGFQPPVVTTIDSLVASCHEGDFALAVVVLSGDHHDSAHEAIRRLRDSWSGNLLVVGPATDPKLILRSMQAGAGLFLDEADLVVELDVALTRILSQRGEVGGQVLAVASASGGCGASTVAVNLAALLAKSRGRCHLIDLNPGKADLAALLDLKPQYTLADLCRNENRLDRTLFEKLLTPHASGIGLLAAPRQLEDIHAVTVGGVTSAIRLAQESFDVVVDLEDCFRAEQVAVLELTTRVILVCRLDFTALRNTRWLLDHLADRGVARERIEVVVNHAGLPNDLPIVDAEIALGGGITRFIPHDPETVGRANNTGIPVAIQNPDAAVVQGIARLVGLDSPTLTSPTPFMRLQTRFRTQAVTWLSAQWRKIRHFVVHTPPAPPAPTEESKTSHEPNPAPQKHAPDSQTCAV